MISIGIGLHNFGEGLAIGAAVGIGSIAFSTFLIVGFALHITTEGIAIAAPMSRGKLMIGKLAIMGLIAGSPAIFGAWIGGFAYSPFTSVVFLAIGAGAIFQVILVLIKWIQKENDGNKIIPQIKENLSENLKTEINFRRVENVGPKVSSELLQSGIIAISLSLAAMLFYIWIRFEWQFSLGAIAALFHDVIVTLGLFSLLGLEINLSIIAAVLTIVGYSMNDTVVIFDRVRENLRKYSDIKIYELTNISINETLSRTLITSITTLLALLSIFFFGGAILKGFSLAMIFGVVFGNYSSIYIANTVLVRLKVSQKTVLSDNDKV